MRRSGRRIRSPWRRRTGSPISAANRPVGRAFSVRELAGDSVSMLDKIKTLGELGEIAAAARAKGRKVVLAHGVFDILHVGHKRHLDIGKRHGDMLIVTLTTDRFVNKGPDRPVFVEKLRAEMIAALECVDYVGISPNPGAEPVLEIIKPSYY